MMYDRRDFKSNMSKLFSTVGIILFIDYLTKSKILLLTDNPWWLIPDKLGLNVVYNPGIAFSLPLGGNLAIFTSLSIVLLLFFYFFKYTRRNFHARIGFGMVIGGALGNVFDRISYGSVIDFIQIYWYPVFNVADIFITAGFLWIIVYHKRFEKL
jgi:signal peptidase II